MESKDIIVRIRMMADSENDLARDKREKIHILNAEISIHRDMADNLNKFSAECEATVNAAEKEKK